jgi:tetratricopeptide (TPR) repeat protein
VGGLRTLKQLGALTLAAAALGCGAARARKANDLAILEADRQVLEGCFKCLDSARATYDRLASEKHVTDKAGVVVRSFETNVVLALRAKELNLDPQPAIARARELVPRVPAVLEPTHVLDIVDAVMPDNNGLSYAAETSLRRKRADYVAKIDTELTWLEQTRYSPAVRKYVGLSIDCSFFDRKKTPGDTSDVREMRRQVPVNAPPLTAYRAATCGKGDSLALKRVLLAAPNFHEAGYQLADQLWFTAGETGGDNLRKLFEPAYKEFPRSPGVTFAYGQLYSLISDCENAIRLFDETIAIEAAHDRALLQKTICQSNLRLDSAAIATATQFIALNPPNVAEGYYWRASNRLRRRELDLARTDIETAKSKARRGEILTLAGVIEHEQNDLAVAESDLKEARAAFRGSENCTAAFYLGSVQNKRQGHAEAAAAFDSAMVCYEDRINVTLGQIDLVKASTKGSAAFRAKRIAALETELADRRKRYYASAFNAASMSAKTGNLTRAGELLAVADGGEDLAEQISKLRAEITRVTAEQAAAATTKRPPKKAAAAVADTLNKPLSPE